MKSGAAATPTSAWTRSGAASAASSMTHAPMLEPTRSAGPLTHSRRIASASSRHALIVPSTSRPEDSPWP